MGAERLTCCNGQSTNEWADHNNHAIIMAMPNINLVGHRPFDLTTPPIPHKYVWGSEVAPVFSPWVMYIYVVIWSFEKLYAIQEPGVGQRLAVDHMWASCTKTPTAVYQGRLGNMNYCKEVTVSFVNRSSRNPSRTRTKLSDRKRLGRLLSTTAHDKRFNAKKSKTIAPPAVSQLGNRDRKGIKDEHRKNQYVSFQKVLFLCCQQISCLW